MRITQFQKVTMLTTVVVALWISKFIFTLLIILFDYVHIIK